MSETTNGVTPKQNAIERVLDITLTKLKSMVDTGTVIGEGKTLPDGTTIIPVSRVTMGYMGGGGEYKKDVYDKKKKEPIDLPFAGGSGAALSLSPIGFLVGKEGNFKIISMDSQSPIEKIVDVASDFLSREVKKHVKKD